MARQNVTILVLETDEPHPDTQQEHGSFGDIFRRLFIQAGENHDPPLEVELRQHFVVEDPDNGMNGHVPNASEIGEDIHAVLITGSMYDAHGDDPWVLRLRGLVEELWQSREDMKFSGVCFGHQLLARTLGATVSPTPGQKWELSHTSMNLTPLGRRLFRTASDTLSVHQMHQDQVTTIPSHATTALLRPDDAVRVWASTPHTPVQGLYLRDRLFTSQGHLGFDEKMVRRQIELRQEAGAIGERDAREVREAGEKAHLEHDGEVVAGAIVRFFAGDDDGVE